MDQDGLDKVKDLISDGNSLGAAELLISILEKEKNSPLVDDARMIKGRIENLERAVLNGAISPNDRPDQDNLIFRDLLAVVNKAGSLYREKFDFRDLFRLFTPFFSFVFIFFVIASLLKSFYVQDIYKYIIFLTIAVAVIVLTLTFHFLRRDVSSLYKRLRESILLLSILYLILPKVIAVVGEQESSPSDIRLTYILAIVFCLIAGGLVNYISEIFSSKFKFGLTDFVVLFLFLFVTLIFLSDLQTLSDKYPQLEGTAIDNVIRSVKTIYSDVQLLHKKNLYFVTLTLVLFYMGFFSVTPGRKKDLKL